MQTGVEDVSPLEQLLLAEQAEVCAYCQHHVRSRPCALTTALRVIARGKSRRFRNHFTNTADALIACEREIRQTIRPQSVRPSLRLPGQCRIVVMTLSVKPGMEDMWGRGVLFYADGARCVVEELGEWRRRHRALKLALPGLWIEELRIHPRERQATEIQKALKSYSGRLLGLAIIEMVGGFSLVNCFQGIDHGYAMVFSASYSNTCRSILWRWVDTSNAIWFQTHVDFYRPYGLGIAAFDTLATGVMKQQALAKLRYGPDLNQNQSPSTLSNDDSTLELVPAQVWRGPTCAFSYRSCLTLCCCCFFSRTVAEGLPSLPSTHHASLRTLEAQDRPSSPGRSPRSPSASPHFDVELRPLHPLGPHPIHNLDHHLHPPLIPHRRPRAHRTLLPYSHPLSVVLQPRCARQTVHSALLLHHPRRPPARYVHDCQISVENRLVQWPESRAVCA